MRRFLMPANCNDIYRTFTQPHPRNCHLYAYVDDTALQLVAPAATIARVAAEATDKLQHVLVVDLQCVLNKDKTVVI